MHTCGTRKTVGVNDVRDEGAVVVGDLVGAGTAENWPDAEQDAVEELQFHADHFCMADGAGDGVMVTGMGGAQ